MGPNFTAPAPPASHSYTSEKLPDQTLSTPGTGGEPQRFESGRNLPAEWWTLFGSSTLDALINDAIRQYPTLQAQQAALREAQENVAAEQGNLYPQLQGNASGTRERLGGAAFGRAAPPSFLTSIFSAAVQVSYTFDIWGGERRAIEGLKAQVDYEHFEYEGSFLTLVSNLVAAAVQLASAHDQIEATRAIVSSEESQLDLARRRFAVGSVTQADVLSAEAQLNATKATIPPLQQSLSQAQHELAVLTGRSPGDIAPLSFALSQFKLPEDIPVSLPSSLVRQRPDIRAQEALMHRASADIGVATANLLPQVTLNASYGGASTTTSKLFTGSGNLWSLAAGVTQPLFEGGKLLAKRGAAVAAYDQAAAQYRQTVLTAFQNVADALTALDNDAQTLNAQYAAAGTAQASVSFAERQYAGGAVTYLSLLVDQQQYQQARLAYLRALAARYQDTVTLFQALGGSWAPDGSDQLLHAASNVPPADEAPPRSLAHGR